MHCSVRNLFLLSALSDGELHILNRERTSINLKAGDPLYHVGTAPQGLLCLSAGKIKLEKDNLNGGKQIISLYKPSEFIGFTDLLGQTLYTSSAIALENSTVCFIPKLHFNQVLQSNQMLALRVIEYLAAEISKIVERSSGLTQKHMRARLADAILYTYERYNHPNNNEIQVALKRSDLAALSNMTTANAIRTLSEFIKDKHIEVQGRKIKILDFTALRKISQLG